MNNSTMVRGRLRRRLAKFNWCPEHLGVTSSCQPHEDIASWRERHPIPNLLPYLLDHSSIIPSYSSITLLRKENINNITQNTIVFLHSNKLYSFQQGILLYSVLFKNNFLFRNIFRNSFYSLQFETLPVSSSFKIHNNQGIFWGS